MEATQRLVLAKRDAINVFPWDPSTDKTMVGVYAENTTRQTSCRWRTASAAIDVRRWTNGQNGRELNRGIGTEKGYACG